METRYNKLSTSSWSIWLPESWKQDNDSRRQSIYFESEDETKGIYFGAWKFDEDSYKDSVDAAKAILELERTTFNEMQDYKWKIQQYTIDESGDIVTAIIDNYDPDKSYRIICKVIACLPVVVRVSFHDYMFDESESSQEVIDSVIKSFEIVKNA